MLQPENRRSPRTVEGRNQARRLHVFRRAEELGKVTAACDAATSYGVARVLGLTQPMAQAAGRLLRRALVPHFREAGWPIEGVLPDRGSGFQGAFDATCQQRGIEATRTRPRPYNHDRRHHGDRTRGRRPADLFVGAQDDETASRRRSTRMRNWTG